MLASPGCRSPIDYYQLFTALILGAGDATLCVREINMLLISVAPGRDIIFNILSIADVPPQTSESADNIHLRVDSCRRACCELC